MAGRPRTIASTAKKTSEKIRNIAYRSSFVRNECEEQVTREYPGYKEKYCRSRQPPFFPKNRSYAIHPCQRQHSPTDLMRPLACHVEPTGKPRAGVFDPVSAHRLLHIKSAPKPGKYCKWYKSNDKQYSRPPELFAAKYGLPIDKVQRQQINRSDEDYGLLGIYRCKDEPSY